MSSNHTLHIGLFGANGHQLCPALSGNTRVVAVAGLPTEGLDPSIRAYGSLDELLADPEVDLISLCAPRRVAQIAAKWCPGPVCGSARAGLL